jgi:hypothetical protein
MFWEDDISKKLKESGRENAGTLWKISNLLMVPALLSIFSLIIGVVLLVIGASAYFLFGESPTTETIRGIFPVVALLLFILSGFLSIFFIAYSVTVAIIAADFNDLAWAAMSAILGVPAPLYKYIKAREIREKGLQLKNPK